jgi:sporulation protein YlmC with PRC-barrel domain
MKRIITITALVLAFGFGFVYANAYAGTGLSKGRFRSFETSKLIGTIVKDPTGESVGKIRDFVLDSNGHIDFVILSHYLYDFNSEYVPYYPIPRETVAVPFSAITIKPNEKIAALKFNGSELDFAPQFVMSDLNNRKWAENVYKYYGLQPYWTEGEYTRRMSSTMNEPMSEQMLKPYTLREQKEMRYIWGYSPNSDSYMDSYHW